MVERFYTALMRRRILLLFTDLGIRLRNFSGNGEYSVVDILQSALGEKFRSVWAAVRNSKLRRSRGICLLVRPVDSS